MTGPTVYVAAHPKFPGWATGQLAVRPLRKKDLWLTVGPVAPERWQVTVATPGWPLDRWSFESFPAAVAAFFNWPQDPVGWTDRPHPGASSSEHPPRDRRPVCLGPRQDWITA